MRADRSETRLTLAIIAPLPAEIAAVFSGMAPDMRARLQDIRALIFATADGAEGVGPIVETLKWNEPAYLPKRPRTGTTVRINRVKTSHTSCAVYFHCQTTLVETFRGLYPGEFGFEGRRALIMDIRKPLPREALAHCLALAFTYHRRK